MKTQDEYLISKIKDRLKELSEFMEKKEIPLEELADKVYDFFNYIEDNIYFYKRENSVSIKQKIKSYPIGR